MEGLLNFIAEAIKVGQASPIVGMPPRIVSIKSLYQESLAAGLTIDAEAVTEVEQENG